MHRTQAFTPFVRKPAAPDASSGSSNGRWWGEAQAGEMQAGSAAKCVEESKAEMCREVGATANLSEARRRRSAAAGG